MSKIDFSAAITAADKAGRAEAEAQARARDDAASYLAQTDWMSIRHAETGQQVPAEVQARRAAARQLLSTR